MKSLWTSKILSNLAILLTALSGLFGIVNARVLYADGSFVLWWILKNQNFFTYDSRIVAHLVTQFPIVVGTQAGITDVSTLTILLGIGVIGLPTGLWVWALVLLRRDTAFWPFVATFAVVTLNSSFISIGEYNFTFSLVAVIAAYLLRSRQTFTSTLIPFVLATFTLFTYESMVFLGPLLAVFCLLRIFKRPKNLLTKIQKILLALASLMFLVSAAIGAYWILNPRDVANLNEAAKIFNVLVNNPQLSVSSAAYLLILLFGRARGLQGKVLLIIASLLCLFLLFPAIWATPIQHYESRVICSGLFLLALLVIGYSKLIKKQNHDSYSNLTAATGNLYPMSATLLLLCLMVPISVLSFKFGIWTSEFEGLIQSGSGTITTEEAKKYFPGIDEFMWSWTNEFLSADFRNGNQGFNVLSPPGAQEVWQELKGSLPAEYGHGMPVVVWYQH